MNHPTSDIKEFLGLRNKHDPRRLPHGALTLADNVDVDDYKGLVRREGYVRATTQIDITASFATQDERRLFIVEAGTLFLVHADLTATALQDGVGSEYIYWLEIADYVLMSTGHVIDKNNTVASWRVPRPNPPDVEVINGELPEGEYHVVTTYIDSTGREGGASTAVIMQVSGNSGLQVSASILPLHTARVYVTDTNGTIYYKVSEGNADVIMRTMQGYTSPLDGIQLRADAVPEDVGPLGFYDSRLWACQTVDGQSVVWFSQPFWWNLFDLYGDYLAIPGVVNTLVGSAHGMVIGTDDEIYLYTAEGSLVRLAEYGTPKGVPHTTDDKGTIYLWTNQGLCMLFPFENLTEDKTSLPPGAHVHAKHVQHGGYSKVVVLTDGLGTGDNNLRG
ncbi:MAG: hypothetical protein KAG66_00530 [Methylococcales bacterium]|nr:hypothetical protein [Methylococcales bacterium]